jgi:hypothetical protein
MCGLIYELEQGEPFAASTRTATTTAQPKAVVGESTIPILKEAPASSATAQT